MKYLSILFGCSVALSTPLLADVKVSNVFSDNMVLQRGMKVPVWGIADAGEKVTVEFNGQSVSATATGEGSWKAELGSMNASSEPMKLTVRGKNAVTISNVLVGDVWLCSGQSNMAFTLEKDIHAATEIPKSANSNIRFLLTGWQSSDTPLTLDKLSGREGTGSWSVASPATVGNLTAVGYWFAKNVQQSTGVPIGLLTAYKGGSPVEAWMPKEALQASNGGPELWAEYEAALKVFPEKNQAYEAETKLWREKVKGLPLAEWNNIKRPQMPYGPMDGNRPCGLFYGSVMPYTAFSIKGVLWYQGESNACSPMRKAATYESSFTNLIRSWRAAWGREDMPFLFVQLPGFRAVSPEPEDSVWSRVRDSQTRTLALPHTGMAVTLDVGNEKDIHPTNKQPVGDRLAQWAKATVYGMDVVPSGPLYESMVVRGDKVVITFKHAGKGLEVRDLTLVGGHQLGKDRLQGFTICGADQQFVHADALITAPDQVTVSSPSVTQPVAVRYAWSSFPLCNLFNKDVLPASSFRTDTLAQNNSKPMRNGTQPNKNPSGNSQ